MKRHLLNLEPKEYSKTAKRILDKNFIVLEQEMSRAELIKNISKYEVIIVRLGHKIDKEVLEHAKKLKIIVTATTGLNHIDIDEAKKRECSVLSLKGEVDFLDTVCATAEHTMALMLSLLRNIPNAFEDVKSGSWDRNKFKGKELNGKKLGILGYGRLGKKVAKYATAFGMTVIMHDIKKNISAPNVTSVSLNNLLENSDILSIHLPYTSETHHFLDTTAINKIKSKPLIINTSRGEVIEESALLLALETGHIAGAAIDVMQGEYCGNSLWADDAPLINYARIHNNLIITPHIGGATYESMENTEIFMANKLTKFIAGT